MKMENDMTVDFYIENGLPLAKQKGIWKILAQSQKSALEEENEDEKSNEEQVDTDGNDISYEHPKKLM